MNDSSSQPGTGNPARSRFQSGTYGKLLVAHHMVGNTYSYSEADWRSDMQLAARHGIGGFALNVGNNPWQADRVSAAFAAAKGSPFKLFLSFDMTSLPGSTVAHAAVLKNYISTYARHPNQLRWDDKVVVSTFSGESCTFGRASANSGWLSAVKDEGMPPVHFIPSFFNAPSVTYPVVDGDFNWNGAWPMGNHDVNFDTDERHIAGNQGKTYMAAVSPWFFTHYGPDSWNKNWIYRGDEWLYNVRWEHLIHNRDKIDIVQILTWNDYGESNYIGPIRADQPNSQAWVDGFDHHGWLRMTEYYATAFKTGAYPKVQEDALYAWCRPHPTAAVATNPAAPRPSNADWTEDFLWVVAFAVSPAQVTLVSGPTSKTFIVPTGVSKLKLAACAGAQAATMARDNNVVAVLKEERFKFDLNPEAYNFNAYVAASSLA